MTKKGVVRFFQKNVKIFSLDLAFRSQQKISKFRGHQKNLVGPRHPRPSARHWLLFSSKYFGFPRPLNIFDIIIYANDVDHVDAPCKYRILVFLDKIIPLSNRVTATGRGCDHQKSSDVFVPRTKTKMDNRAFWVAGPRTWNSR